MSDMLADGLAWLTGQLKSYASQSVIYTRGPDSVQVQATFGKKLLKLDDGFGGIRMEWTDIDFLIPAADLVLPYAGPIIPARGDIVYVTHGYDEQGFEVFPFGNEAPWRWADPHQSMFRIHTKWINDATIGH